MVTAMTHTLNSRAQHVLAACNFDDLNIIAHDIPEGGRVYDCGITAAGGLQAGLLLSKICVSGLADVSLVPGELKGFAWPHVQVVTDHPVEACLLSQYAGWQIAVEKFFAMGSGPMRAAAAREDIFKKLSYHESATHVVGVLEGRKIPTAAVFATLAEKCGVTPAEVTLLVAPTASLAGNLQVIARVVETALHKLHEVGFDVRRIRSATGVAPLPPVAQDDMTGIGRTNDAILYGGRVTLWVQGDDESIAEIGTRVPAASSAAYGQPFTQIFEKAGRDFYKIDPHLFSPGEITFHNLDTGRTQRFGKIAPEVLRTSFDLP